MTRLADLAAFWRYVFTGRGRYADRVRAQARRQHPTYTEHLDEVA